MSRTPPRTVVFSCAGAPLGAEILRAVHERDPQSLEGIVAVVLSRPRPQAERKGRPAARGRGLLGDTRLAVAYRRRRLSRKARSLARRALRRFGWLPAGRWRYIEDFVEERGLPVHATRDPASPETEAFLRRFTPDLVVMMTFHHILRARTLAIPTHGVVNVHCSLLPDFRGPDPIGDALRTGVTETGISLHQVDTGIDTGPVIAQRRVRIAPEDRDPHRLRQRLAQEAGAPVAALLCGAEAAWPATGQPASATR